MTKQVIGPEDLGATLDAMREGLQIIDREFRYIFVNHAAASHGRRAPEDLLGRTMMECFPGIDETEMFATLRRCMSDRVSAFVENRFTYPDGSMRTFELRIQPCAPGLSVLSIDVTDARHLEARLRQAQKLEAVGRLAGGVAHDFNNLLSVILSYTSLMMSDLPPGDPLQADLEQVKMAGERAAELTRQLLAFSRNQPIVPQVVDLNHVVVGLEKMLRRLMSAEVSLAVVTATPIGAIYADPGELEQVIVNLVVNARDAMPGGGTVAIETANVDLGPDFATEHPGVSPGPHVMLTVSDTGIGMDAATQEQIFEPFFTTKAAGAGTGLGLATAFGVVRRAGGTIDVRSEPGRGTTFAVYLPCTDRIASAPDDPTTPSATLDGGETILLVEDNEQLRAILRSILRAHGYRVLEAQHGAEGLVVAEAHPADIHLLLTDVVMPQMGGRELAERLTSRRPRLRVLYVSGHNEHAILQHGGLGPCAAFLQKPITPDVVLRSVRALLDATRA